jgi:aspartyl/asparaginyl beta-hydroxylase (cupin superfamily)
MSLKRQLATIALLVLTFSMVPAQTSTKSETFTSFWKTFKAAVARNDKEAVADLTKLPFLYDSQERDRAGFLKIYGQLFTRKVRRCIATAKPGKEGDSYEVFCGELIFYFSKDADGRYKLREFGVND